jgi:hypothetical protein
MQPSIFEPGWYTHCNCNKVCLWKARHIMRRVFSSLFLLIYLWTICARYLMRLKQPMFSCNNVFWKHVVIMWLEIHVSWMYILQWRTILLLLRNLANCEFVQNYSQLTMQWTSYLLSHINILVMLINLVIVKQTTDSTCQSFLTNWWLSGALVLFVLIVAYQWIEFPISVPLFGTSCGW